MLFNLYIYACMEILIVYRVSQNKYTGLINNKFWKSEG